MKAEYAELHCHSAFSLLNGASMPETLVERAVELGLSGLALTDHNDLGGVVRFSDKARELNHFPAIIGLESTVLFNGTQTHLTLLARDSIGYSHLCRLVTLARTHSPRGIPAVSLEQLARHSDGLICLSGCTKGAVSRAIERGEILAARRNIGLLSDIFQASFFLELMDHGRAQDAKRCSELLRLAHEFSLPWVVTNNVHYARTQDRLVHDVMMCLRHHTTLDEAGYLLNPNRELHLKSPEDIAHRWRHDPDGIRQSVIIAEQCTFRLSDLKAPLPDTERPETYASADDYLRHLTEMGAQRRWGLSITSHHKRQLGKELELIQRRQLSGYFLIMWQIVEFAQTQDILVQGRGSAANSAVCYCLGITAVDPIRHDLLFERFLSDARDGYPDIDLDIEHHRREEVIQFVYEKYGRDHAAMVCTHQCFRGPSAVRDAARVLGLSTDQGHRLAALVQKKNTLSEETLDDAGFDIHSPRIQSLVSVVGSLWGLPRQRGTHVGGFVLSTQPIGSICPIEPAAMEGRTIMQWDKDDLESVKLPKFDLLGLGMLTVLSQGLRLVRSRYDQAFELYNLPERQEIYDMIARADTIGLFQIESRAQMNSLPRTRPNTLYELAIQVALIRPGPLQGDMVHPYIRRKRGEEPIDLIHPKLAPILRRTLGIPLFQEQGMRLAVDAAGFTPDKAEKLRKAIGSSRHRSCLKDLLIDLRAGLAESGIQAETAERIVKQIASFSTYGFPESHSTSFALLVFASAWMKCCYPAEFLCALVNAQPMGFYSVSTLVKDAQRHGVDVRPPCLYHSEWDTKMEDSAVRLGLRQVVGLGAAAQNQLRNARLHSPFTSAEDVISRVHLPRRSWSTLAESGAFDHFIPGGRRAAVWRILYLANNHYGPLPLKVGTEQSVNLPAQSEQEDTAADFRTMGMTTGKHPLLYLREALASKGVLTALELQTTQNQQRVKVAGMVISRQRPDTAKGFMFISLEDESGFVNVIVAPRLFERHKALLMRSRCIQVDGQVSSEQGVWNVKAVGFKDLSMGMSRHFPPGYNWH